MVIKRVDPVSAAKIGGVLYGLLGLVIGACVSVAALVFSSAMAAASDQAGGSMFGLGWALTGACPGPLVALVGAGVPVMLVAILSALVGTWTYGRLRPKLPH